VGLVCEWMLLVEDNCALMRPRTAATVVTDELTLTSASLNPCGAQRVVAVPVHDGE
jgi:hypothetical protein